MAKYCLAQLYMGRIRQWNWYQKYWNKQWNAVSGATLGKLRKSRALRHQTWRTL